jgi:plastocyanin
VLKSAALAGLLAIGSCLGQVAQAADQTITIENFVFTPTETTIAPGTTVTWVNNDDMPHNVVGKGSAFRSKTLGKGARFSFTFANEGEFDYVCSIHPNMKAKIIVKVPAS